MIKHIVMWKLDSSYSVSEKKEKANAIVEMLMGLDGKIDTLKSIAAYTNSENANPDNYDVVLDSEFGSFEDLQAYAIHPEHLKVGGFLKTLKLTRACVDYEL